MEECLPLELQASHYALSPLKALALHAYRMGSLPYRKWLATQQAAVRRARVMLFFYHHVAANFESPWTTSPEVFRDQILWLKSRYRMVSLAESQQRLCEGNNEPTVHITFDDGYADNCTEALPFLISQRVPVTYFVTTSNVLSGKPFEHDLRRRQPLAINTPQQIRAMADAGVEIGSHTRHHVDFSKVFDEATLRDEIIGSKHELEDMIGRPVRYFAFPFGRPDTLTPAALQIAREAGYEAVCSAYGGYNFPGGDAFHLQRMHGDNDRVRFKNWATMDPRKLAVRFTIPNEVTRQMTI